MESDEIWRFFRVYLGVRLRTCELFLCFASFAFLGSVDLTSLFSYFLHHTHEVNSFLQQGRAGFYCTTCKLWIVKVSAFMLCSPTPIPGTENSSTEWALCTWPVACAITYMPLRVSPDDCNIHTLAVGCERASGFSLWSPSIIPSAVQKILSRNSVRHWQQN